MIMIQSHSMMMLVASAIVLVGLKAADGFGSSTPSAAVDIPLVSQQGWKHQQEEDLLGLDDVQESSSSSSNQTTRNVVSVTHYSQEQVNENENKNKNGAPAHAPLEEYGSSSAPASQEEEEMKGRAVPSSVSSVEEPSSRFPIEDEFERLQDELKDRRTHLACIIDPELPCASRSRIPSSGEIERSYRSNRSNQPKRWNRLQTYPDEYRSTTTQRW